MKSRPRLLYFNGPWDYLGDRMIAAYMDPFRRLLEQDFEVISVQGDRNLRKEVEEHRPDMILFHTGTESDKEREIRIIETNAYPEIPRIGYMYRDPISSSRIAAVNRLLRWGVHQTFTCFRPSDAPSRFFENTIYVPWWIEEDLYKDYGLTKDYPISLTGAGWLSGRFFYTWRFPIFSQLISRFPVFHVPVLENHQSGNAYIGERYARLLNQSMFSAGCGSVNRFLTLKPLEIPACRCCLIAEETEVFKAIGFKDGVNCVFADESNVGSKVQALLDNPDRLQQITDAGYELVHQQHTTRSRRMFIEWYHLWKAKGPGQRIVQINPLQPLQLVDENARPMYEFPSENPLVETLRAGYDLFAQKRWKEALAKFENVLGIIPYVAEARLGAGICQFHLHRLDLAQQHLLYNIQTQIRQKTDAWPDVINQAYLAIVWIKMGRRDSAIALLAQRSDLRHPALNSLRWLVASKKAELRRKEPAFQIVEGDETQNVETLHVFPARTFAEWDAVWCELLPTESNKVKAPQVLVTA
ncbi:MAG: glycosyltransferase [Opitutus sp.]